MTWAGLDVGSRTIKLVMLDGADREGLVVETGPNPLRRCQELLSGNSYERLVVTGYGRYLVGQAVGARAVSEIKAHATGARYLYPDCRTVIDIGGQDSKITRLSESGEVQKFEMNDRCAAGTGKFLEIMADTLEVTIDMLGPLAQHASHTVRINSLCTVFAGSEVVSLIARGEETSSIALALHEAIASRVCSMVRRVGVQQRTVFSGGAALNGCLHELLRRKLSIEITVPPQPQLVGALGAAILAREENQQNQQRRTQ